MPGGDGQPLAPASFPSLHTILRGLSVGPIGPCPCVEQHRDDVQVDQGPRALKRVIGEVGVGEESINAVVARCDEVVSTAVR
jgi:hypothetical protein